MADDAIRVVDAYGFPLAHFVGMSLGGMIAQLAALKYPARVASLTTISSSPFGEDNLDLPASSPALQEHFAQFAEVNWADRAEVVRFLVEDSRLISGSAHPFDEERATRLIEHDYDRARNFPSVTNHTRLG